MKRTVRVRVPATTANLGPGFDVLGAALTLYNEVEATAVPGTAKEPALTIEVEGEGADCLPRNEKNIVWRSMQEVFASLPKKASAFASVHLRLVNHVPLSSGLGSSAAARLGGILAANALTGSRLSDEELVAHGVRMEGHPDNIVPAFAGALCVSILQEPSRAVKYIKLPCPELKAVVCNPDFGLPTVKARKVLPKQFPMAAAVFNASRVAFLLAALQTKRYDLLSFGMEDKLHQPARAALIPGMGKVFAAAGKAGAYGAALSGAGPSLVAFCSPDKAEKVARAMQKQWAACRVKSRYFILDFDTDGAKVVR